MTYKQADKKICETGNLLQNLLKGDRYYSENGHQSFLSSLTSNSKVQGKMWSENSVYLNGDIVFLDGREYVCNSRTSFNVDPRTNSDNWKELIPRYNKDISKIKGIISFRTINDLENEITKEEILFSYNVESVELFNPGSIRPLNPFKIIVNFNGPNFQNSIKYAPNSTTAFGFSGVCKIRKFGRLGYEVAEAPPISIHPVSYTHSYGIYGNTRIAIDIGKYDLYPSKTLSHEIIVTAFVYNIDSNQVSSI